MAAMQFGFGCMFFFGLCLIFNVIFYSMGMWWQEKTFLMKSDEIWWKPCFHQISSDLYFLFMSWFKLGILGLKLQCNPFARVWNLPQLEKPTDNHGVTHQIWNPNYQTFCSKNCLLIRIFPGCLFKFLYIPVC